MTETSVKLADIQIGMMTSRDVYTDTDMFLIPADTIINDNHILKLELYQVDTIFVMTDDDISQNSSDSMESLIEPSIVNTPAFIEFSHNYEQQVEKIGDTYLHIVTTGQVDTEAIAEITNEVLDNVTNYNELFTYMCRLQSKDDITYTHVLNVSILANIFAKWLGMSPEDVKNVTIAGMLHDIGKTRVSDDVLKKPGALTDQEYEEMKLHTVYGYKLLANSNLDIGIKQAVLMHHEKMNGHGYPLGVDWDQIHAYTKIIGIVDIYEAMTADRPYRNRLHPFHVIKTFEEECYGVLDTEYLYVFLQHIANNYLGNQVRLIDGRRGKIVFIHPQTPSRPLVEVDGDIIDLAKHNNLQIDSFI